MSKRKEAIMPTIEEQKEKYRDYIIRHKTNVSRAWILLWQSSLGVNGLERITAPSMFHIIRGQILSHDDSKYGVEEFEPYRQWFNPADGEEKNKELFTAAWTHHKENNGHHWEHQATLPMNEQQKFACTIEMICDWMGMAWQNNENIDDYYNKMKDEMTLEDWQRDIILLCYAAINQRCAELGISFKTFNK